MGAANELNASLCFGTGGGWIVGDFAALDAIGFAGGGDFASHASTVFSGNCAGTVSGILASGEIFTVVMSTCSAAWEGLGFPKSTTVDLSTPDAADDTSPRDLIVNKTSNASHVSPCMESMKRTKSCN